VTETGLDLASYVSLAQAKSKALALRKQIANGICPITARRMDKANATTFKEVCDAWVATHRPSWRSASQLKNCNVLLMQHGRALHHLAVKDVTPAHIERALQPLWAQTPKQARRALSMIERVLDYAKAKGYREGDNPAQWKGNMEYRFPKQPATERAHFEAMDYSKVPGFVKELRQRQSRSVAACALEFLILTCARSGEVLKSTWDEFDLESRLWTLAPDRTKQGRAHVVPLSDRAVAILQRQKEFANGSPYVFPGNDGALSDRAMAIMLWNNGMKETVHGFRSSFRDWAGNETSFAREPVEHCLAHKCGNAVEQAYRRGDSLAKRRVIMDAWAQFCG
jgi:integrase